MAKKKKTTKKCGALSRHERNSEDPAQRKQCKKASSSHGTFSKRPSGRTTKTTASDATPLKRSARIYERLQKNLALSEIKAKIEKSTNFNLRVNNSVKPRKNGRNETQNNTAVPPAKRSKIKCQNKRLQDVDVGTVSISAALEKLSKKNRSGLHVLIPVLSRGDVLQFSGKLEIKSTKALTVATPEPLKSSKRFSLRLEKKREKSQVETEPEISSQSGSSNALPISSEAKSSTFKLTENQIGSSIKLELNDEEASQSVDVTFKIPKSMPSRNSRIRGRSTSITLLKPIIRQRTTEIYNDSSDVHLAKKSLHMSEIPKTLPCREKEFKEIYGLIEDNILEKSGGCMHVCGVPGTGKTATVTAVVRSLQLQAEAKTLPQFELIKINGMKLTEPQEVYVNIYHHLTGAKVRWEDAVSKLEQFFKTTAVARKTTILVVDEFEMLRSPGQRVIYNLLDWAMKESSQLLVVAVGNDTDPGLMGKITSRLGAPRFKFLPYTQAQLKTIVLARLADWNIFEIDAVDLVARKVASISGDCRRALDICRHATEIAEKDCLGKRIVVSMSHVVKACDGMITNPKVVGIKGCSKYEKLFLQAVVAEIARTGVDETVLRQVYGQFSTICALNGVTVPEPGIALRISSRLGSSRLLLCEHSSQSIHQKIMLNVTEDEMRYAFD